MTVGRASLTFHVATTKLRTRSHRPRPVTRRLLAAAARRSSEGRTICFSASRRGEKGGKRSEAMNPGEFHPAYLPNEALRPCSNVSLSEHRFPTARGEVHGVGITAWA